MVLSPYDECMYFCRPVLSPLQYSAAVYLLHCRETFVWIMEVSCERECCFSFSACKELVVTRYSRNRCKADGQKDRSPPRGLAG